VQGGLLVPQGPLELGQPPVLELGGPVEVVGAFGFLDLVAHLLDLLANLPDLLQHRLFLLPLGPHRVGPCAQVLQLLAHRLEPLAARRVLLLLEGGLLDLELGDPARDLVELSGHRVDLGADHRARLVDEIHST